MRVQVGPVVVRRGDDPAGNQVQGRTDSVERRYRTLVEELPLITYIDSPSGSDGSAAYVSPQIHEILGYTVDEWRAFPNFFTDHLHPADRKRVRERQRAARE